MERLYDTIIIGSGPAGLSAAIYAAEPAQEVVLIENYAPGGKLVRTSIIENYPGLESAEGTTLAMDMMNHAMNLGAELTAAMQLNSVTVKQKRLLVLTARHCMAEHCCWPAVRLSAS